MTRFVIPASALVLCVSACGGTKTVTVTQTVTRTTTRTVTTTQTQTETTQAGASACLASALTGSFAVIPGSPGAGQISYRLRLTNQGDTPCTVSGLPNVRLLDQSGTSLPTNVTPAHPGSTPARVQLQPGDATTADARFSPDVPGPSEQTNGPCEPKAHTLRVTIGAGSVDVPVVPPTPVCESGTLNFTNFAPVS